MPLFPFGLQLDVKIVNDTIFEKALVKLNRKLQPMVDGIDANRKKWEELCLSYKQALQVSESSNPYPEAGEGEESNQNTESTSRPHAHSYEGAATNQSRDSTHRPESKQTKSH